MGNEIGNKSKTTSKVDKREKEYKMLRQIGKSNTTTKYTPRRDKSEGNGERKKTKKIPRRDQTIQTKPDLPK